MTITIPVPVILIVAYLIGTLSGAWFLVAMDHNDDESEVGSVALFIGGLIILGVWYFS